MNFWLLSSPLLSSPLLSSPLHAADDPPPKGRGRDAPDLPGPSSVQRGRPGALHGQGCSRAAAVDGLAAEGSRDGGRWAFGDRRQADLVLAAQGRLHGDDLPSHDAQSFHVHAAGRRCAGGRRQTWSH